MTEKLKIIDLFAGCGGLLDGFLQSKLYDPLASVEWEEEPCNTLRQRLQTKWKHTNSHDEVICFDIQRTNELLNGFDDNKYGYSQGLRKLIGDNRLDAIIGGPPCQAYSIAGRIRDPYGMRNDYRNFLFESYIRVLDAFRPNFFIFENVVGLLSAKPTGEPIKEIIYKAFKEAGYYITSNLRHAVFDVADFGIPQHRKRVIILGIKESLLPTELDVAAMLNRFYDEILPSFKTQKATVADAIGDLPKFYPLKEDIRQNGKHFSHFPTESAIPNHIPRFHNKRDIEIFHLLADDIKTGALQYVSIERLKELYTQATGKHSNIHKYYVLRENEPSNTIPAHLYKDGMRHIHPDPIQARTITVREAARLQTFDDDFVFTGSMMSQYKMIGNAVPPRFAKIIAQALFELYETIKHQYE